MLENSFSASSIFSSVVPNKLSLPPLPGETFIKEILRKQISQSNALLSYRD